MVMYMKEFCWLFSTIPEGVLTTVYFDGQGFGEVDPSFAGEFNLGASWRVFDTQGRYLDLGYNGSLFLPRLIDGWSRMPSVFGFNGDSIVTFFYFGGDLFGFVYQEPLLTYSDIPFYHSRSQQLPYTALFCIRLTQSNVAQPYLSVFGQFESYLRALQCPFITALCDDGGVRVFYVGLVDEPIKITAIGEGWSGFCEEHGFVDGDIICFKFNLLGASGFAYVYKVYE
ncbi:hypothetical protein L195_g021729 [Trifolium pratense]|uniref:B3 domain-containing protein n=1 Tax=Trifolium pratense TaxID=57577 RepID=A0A2K3N610_TRIPR|nr:hypothetical protein L195_g021729 [Trifolium pratense]